MIKVLFYTFNSQEERRNYGGSAFIEMQFCKLSAATTINQLVAVDSLRHWQNDSLYINDECAFYREYSSIFDCGTYSNMDYGTVDIYGINYYALSSTDSIIQRLCKDKPADYEKLLEWLIESERYNGFYILGI